MESQPETSGQGRVYAPAQVMDLPSALRNGLEELAITVEHVDWMKDLMSGRYPEPVADQLIEHLQEEERQHELSLRALADALRGQVDPALSEELDREVFRLHLMQDHFDTARSLGSVLPELASKIRHHVFEEEDRHLLGLQSLQEKLSGLRPGAASAAAPSGRATSAAPAPATPSAKAASEPTSAPSAAATPPEAPEAPQATVGELVVRVDRSLPRVGSLVGEPMPTASIKPTPMPPATWTNGSTVGSLKDPRL